MPGPPRPRRIGTVTHTMDAVRDQRGLPWLDDLARDVRYGLRTLRRAPLFTTVALLTLAIGIGANTAVFTVVNSVLLKPLPYPNSDEIVAIWHSAPGAPGLAAVSGDLRLSGSMYFTYAEQNRTFRDLGVWYPANATVTGRAEPEEVRALMITDGVLQALAVPPALGRWLSKADQQPGGARTVMIGHGYWQRRFGGDPDVVGRGLIVDSRPSEIVGVMQNHISGRAVRFGSLLPTGFSLSPYEQPHRVAAVEALVAGAVAHRDVAAKVAERGVAHHRAECCERARRGCRGRSACTGGHATGARRGVDAGAARPRVGLPDEVRVAAVARLAVGGLHVREVVRPRYSTPSTRKM